MMDKVQKYNSFNRDRKTKNYGINSQRIE